MRLAIYNFCSGKGGTTGEDRNCVDAILDDQRAVLTVCTRMVKVAGVSDVTVCLPHLVGGEGNLGTFHLSLNEEETEALRASAQFVREAIEALKGVR